MIRNSSVSLAAASLAMLATIPQTAAGGRVLECYEARHRPALYDTVYEDVMVSPGGQFVHYDAPIYGTRESVEPIGPARVTYEAVPAVTRTVYRTVKVDNGGYGWEWRVIHGRKVLCKVWRKARYARIAETVVVEPERVRRVVLPAEYESVAREVLVRPGQRRITEIPPSYRTVARRVVLRDGSTSWRRVHIRQHCPG
ncbi:MULTISPECIES: hypothetical protein [unclassified Mesorhizobium]|uniref:hypothetical protein n=1 Tax=unclassified Mesorhizobium TaxID=325217 RepID=UPI000BAFF281|nr:MULTISPECIES: hypothetical protein [unclassified Mesorhizobium]TGT59650.1 hypothetical protein EN813_029120 [Mesorhizobium sp. M00.F.Ca.ET.170.01.1.1]AZO12656.1 hypothetical protein EJ074_28675 [Mesorhizobium sp. M3A.F.Ca.ET.080.04.2.1]PBB87213.1 hypothetical protein CK216_09675 [Mesorhizobium sp. WSM3876]RWB71372.1 MAG: hypothetical protein EOQ49_15775 [Mesorhizobium sp.]RWB91127.1 MAG: hypothetical protein EOQ52_06775 [Mesorhizobium sp.]